MSLQQARQDFLGPLFQPGAFVVGRLTQLPDNPLQLPYHGPLASERQEPHDIAVRAHANGTYKEKVPLGVWARQYMTKYPDIYRLFERYAKLAAGSGRKCYSGKAIVETIRWNEEIEHGRPFKCPNALTRFMVERFIEEQPQFAGLFRTQKRTSGQ